MKCPSCHIGIKLDVKGRSVFALKTSIVNGKEGIELVYGLCPECGDFIATINRGSYRFIDEEEGEITEIKQSVIIFPTITSQCVSEEVPKIYRDMFNEAASVINISPKSSAALNRRLLQTLLRDVYHVKHGNLANEIKEFCENPSVSQPLKDEVDAIRHIGNFAAHPNKYMTTGEIVNVEPHEAEWLLEIIEHIFEECFINFAKDQERRNNLNKKLNDLGKPPLN
ncbi:MAG: hypothetical protein CVU39_00035 [Chloroflexi bacterium HGW-Chloroflexi-10]|nr:MAG: hypothetical protein CVU39_00035 [Chloroflexi bacterium HGW-Chloroflexi-10]